MYRTKKKENDGRSREGAWIEMLIARTLSAIGESRSREGAWIEIIAMIVRAAYYMVAPVRERGLKFIPVSLLPCP